MTPEDNVDLIRSLQGRVAEAAAPVANDMASTMDRAVRTELTRVSHAPGMFWLAPRRQPPAFVTGHLVMSQFIQPAFGLIQASALVGNSAKYAGVQEWGARTWPSKHRYMHWVNSGGSWYKKLVDVPPHPYYEPALRRIILDGSLQGHAMSTFESYMSPLIR